MPPSSGFRQSDFAESVRVERLSQSLLDGVPDLDVSRKDVVCAANGMNHGLAANYANYANYWRNSGCLRLFPHRQVHLFVLVISLGVFIDIRHFLVREFAFDFGGHAKNQTAWRNLRTFSKQRTGAYD